MRHPVVLACAGLVIAIVAASGIASLPLSSNQGCADPFGTRDATVSVHLVPFGLECAYTADSTGPAETVVLAPSVLVFAAWLLCVGAVVAAGLRRRALPAARGVVAGVTVLGLFGFFAAFWEMNAALIATAVLGVALAAVVDCWLWPIAGRWPALVSTAVLLPFGVLATWLVSIFGAAVVVDWTDSLAGWAEPVADAVALVAAGAIAAAFGRVRTLASPPRTEPLSVGSDVA